MHSMSARDFRLSAILLLGLLGCGESSDEAPTAPPPPPPAPPRYTLVVETLTEGVEIDPDGYTLVVAGNVLGIAASGSVAVHDLVPGSHSVTIDGLAPNCRLPRVNSSSLVPLPDEAWEETRDVYVGSPEAHTSFAITCYSVGSLKLVVLPREDTPITDFRVLLNHDPRSQVVKKGAEVTIDNVSSGLHRLDARPATCFGPPTIKEISIVAGKATYDTVKAAVTPCY